MKNKPYLSSILGGTDFRSLSLIEKIRYFNAVFFMLMQTSCKPSRSKRKVVF